MDAELRERTSLYVNASMQSFDRASQYDSAIMAGGYALFFAFWTYAAGKVATWVCLFSGGLIGVSAIFYIGFTIGMMIARQRAATPSLAVIAQGLEAPNFITAYNSAHERGGRILARYMRWAWLPTFIISLVCGISGAGLLAGAMIDAGASRYQARAKAARPLDPGKARAVPVTAQPHSAGP